jgi:hypothetical protein
MPDTPTCNAAMRDALAEVVRDAEAGVLAWHDIGQTVAQRLPRLRALLETLKDSFTATATAQHADYPQPGYAGPALQPAANAILCDCPCHDGSEIYCDCCARKGETRPLNAAQLAQGSARAARSEAVPGVAPDRIYLGTGCDEPECAGTCYFERGAETTWCRDRLGPYDVEYVRADLATPQPSAPGGGGERDRLEDERNDLQNSFGDGRFSDGLVRDRIRRIDERIAELAAAQSSADDAPRQSALRYFCWDDGVGFDTYATLDEARKAAQESLDEYRNSADEGWPEETDNLCYGVILGGASVVSTRPMTEDEAAHYGEAGEIINYGLVDDAAAFAPPADARDAVDARRYRWLRSTPHAHIHRIIAHSDRLHDSVLLQGDELDARIDQYRAMGGES